MGGLSINRAIGSIDYFNLIPADTEILISHSPAHGVLDRLKDGTSVGEPELSKAINNLSQLKLVCCGHIHESYGRVNIKGVRYVNAALLDADYRPRNSPWIIYL